MRTRLFLPIDPILPELMRSLEKAPNLVLKAAPGSGKTTRVPPALLGCAFAQAPSEILVLEPRRLAAKYSARRVAEEMGEEVGRTVGYQFRFENVGSPQTRLRFLTEGMLMRRLLSDPTLKRVSAVLLDEFHERHLHTDTALVYLRHLQKTSRPDLRLIVMSATLDTQQISGFLGDCPILEVENRPYPVSIHYLPAQSSAASPKPLELLVRDAVLRAIENDSSDERGSGDVLVFLPGMGEIRRAEQALEAALGSSGLKGPLILPLHGELAREDQDRAIRRSDRRKIILSTNVAETSLTIDGVTTVIDSGLHRIATYSWWSGVPALKTRPISRASAIQRAGRAGRTAPGRCFRLYSQGDFEGRAPFETPEIQRADLSQTLLELKTMRVADPSVLEWFEAPAPASLEASWKLLYRLGAIQSASSSSSLTALGERLAGIPTHPRLARFLIEASKLDCLEDAATIAAWIGEGRLEKLDALECLKIPMGESQKRVRSQLLSALRDRKMEAPRTSLHQKEDRLRFALLTGFPDRVSRKRKAPASSQRAQAAETELLFSSGGSARVEESGVVLEGDFFVTLDMRETQHLGQARSRFQIGSVSPIRMDWLLDLEPSLLEDRIECSWDAQKQRVMQLSQLRYDELVLEESSRPAISSDDASRALMKGSIAVDSERANSLGITDWIHALNRIGDAEQIESALARALLLKKYFPELAPSFDPSKGFAPLTGIFSGKTSLAELKEADLAAEILLALVPDALGQMERWLPDSLTLPGGRRTRIHYALDKSPWVESRLQDFFGMKSAPALLDGRLPLTLHLLAPNQRAVQVTTDLAGFWERGYREQRNALSRRYPRHAWPEDPLKATPPAPKSR